MSITESRKKEHLLLILPVPMGVWDGEQYMEEQSCNGISLWLENFNHVTVACPLSPKVNKIDGYNKIKAIKDCERLKCVPLPFAYHPVEFIKYYKRTVSLLKEMISKSDYLCFAIGGFWGDWASLAGLIASKYKKPFSVWTDRVESAVVWEEANKRAGLKKLYYKFLAILMSQLEKNVIKKSTLGLFHGKDCYDAYSIYTKNSFCVHDIHLSEEDQITELDLEEKIRKQNGKKTIKLLYVGRVTNMKGPKDWVEIIEKLINANLSIEATWAGDGDLRSEIIDYLLEMKIEDKIHFVGNINNRAVLLELIKDSDLFVFCHKTPESPRCLIESLMLGCPIIGYKSFYPVDLVAIYGGGCFADVNDIDKMVEILSELVVSHEKRSSLIRDAAMSGKQFADKKVFKERSLLIKKYLEVV